MTRYQPLWLQAGSYAASVDRRLISALWPTAATSGGAATVQAGTMVVSVAAGQAAVPAANGTGSTLCAWDAPETVTVATLTGNNRIDLITVWPQSADIGNGTGDTFTINVVQGTPAATPVAPATPTGQVALYQVYVTGGNVALVAANLTDVRPGGLAVAGGAAQPPYTGAGIGTMVDPSGEVWVARSTVNGGQWRRAKDAIHAEAYRNAAWTVATANTDTPIPLDTVAADPMGLITLGTNAVFTCPVTGVYLVEGAAQATANTLSLMRIMANAVPIRQFGPLTMVGATVMVTGTARCTAGQTIYVACRVNTASSAMSVGPFTAYSAFHYLGTG
jgi:hypothetical protein